MKKKKRMGNPKTTPPPRIQKMDAEKKMSNKPRTQGKRKGRKGGR